MFRKLLHYDQLGTEKFFSLQKSWQNKSSTVAKAITYQRWKRLMRRHCACIPLTTEFKGNATFPHGITGIFISIGAKIGKDCVIFHQCTIGSTTLRDSKGFGAPVIGDNVYIGAGAKIIGNVHIGNHVRIGANCVVTEDVPDNATVVLPRPRVISRESKNNNEYIAWNRL